MTGKAIPVVAVGEVYLSPEADPPLRLRQERGQALLEKGSDPKRLFPGAGSDPFFYFIYCDVFNDKNKTTILQKVSGFFQKKLLLSSRSLFPKRLKLVLLKNTVKTVLKILAQKIAARQKTETDKK